MTAYSEIDDAAAARIATVDNQTTEALNLVDAFMPTIEALAVILAPYYFPGTAQYVATQFDASGVVSPSFKELDSADTALQEAGSQNLPGLNAGSDSLFPGLKVPVDTADAETEAIWNDLQAAFGDSRPTIGFAEDAFIAEIIDEVQEKLIDSLGADPGASSATESTYYQKDAARRNAAHLKEQNDTLNEFAGRGFSLPADIQADLAAVVFQKQSMAEADRARTVIIQQSTLSQENKTRAIEAGLRYDQILVSYFDRKMQRAFQVATAGLKVMQDLADMKFYVLKERMGVQKEYFDLISENQRLIFDEFEKNMQAFSARMDGLVSRAGHYMDAYSTEGQVYGLRQRALNENRKFSLSEGEISIDTLRWNLGNSLKAFSDNIDTFEATADIRLKAAAAGADVQIGIAEAARSSITTIVGILTSDKTASTPASGA